MDAAHDIEALLHDDVDDLLIPPRSPSRLDFCMEDVDSGSSILDMEAPPTHALEALSWDPFSDDAARPFVEQEALEIDFAPLPVVEDPPQPTDSLLYDRQGTPAPETIPQEHQVGVDLPPPLAPIPVRPPVSQFPGAQEPMPPSLPTCITPQRLNYTHHGFSRSALLQQKMLWNSRHEEWTRLQQAEAQGQEPDADDAYTGIATAEPRATVTVSPPGIGDPPSGLERDFADLPLRKCENVRASIHPRMGDISALRDPCTVAIDRSFFRYPLWTLYKGLYMFDMHQTSGSCASYGSVHDVKHIEAFTSSSTSGSYYASPTPGDDQKSDSTLVAKHGPSPPRESSKRALSSHSPSSWASLCQWTLSWYSKWELLIDLFQPDLAACDFPADPAESFEVDSPPPSPARSKFHFHVDEHENNDDIDEEEDYGTVISRTSFGTDFFEEECRRAMAFYNRERFLAQLAS